LRLLRKCFSGLIQLVALAAKALTNIDETRVGLGLPRSDVFIWVCAIVFLNQLFGVARETLMASRHEFLWNLGSVGVFQIMAWYVVFRLLASSDPAPAAQLRDVVVAVALCCVLAATPRLIWVTALGIAIFGSLFNRGDPKLRAAGIVLAALSVRQFWGRIFFNLFALPLLRSGRVVQRMKYKSLAVLGLTEYAPSRRLLLIEAPTDCRAAQTIDWRSVWNRRNLTAQANAAAISKG
jgi:hypothetical protein